MQEGIWYFNIWNKLSIHSKFALSSISSENNSTFKKQKLTVESTDVKYKKDDVSKTWNLVEKKMLTAKMTTFEEHEYIYNQSVVPFYLSILTEAKFLFFFLLRGEL